MYVSSFRTCFIIIFEEISSILHIYSFITKFPAKTMESQTRVTILIDSFEFQQIFKFYVAIIIYVYNYNVIFLFDFDKVI